MLALCLMLSVTYYAQNNAGIIGWSLTVKYDDFPCTISYIGRIVQMKIPATGRYQITAKRAKAADDKCHKEGRGVIISAVFILQKRYLEYIVW